MPIHPTPESHRHRPVLVALAAGLGIVALCTARPAAATAPIQSDTDLSQRRPVLAQWGGSALAVTEAPDGDGLVVGIGMRVHRLHVDEEGRPSLADDSALLGGEALDLVALPDRRHVAVAAGRAGLAVVDLGAEGGPALVAQAGLPASARGARHFDRRAAYVAAHDSLVVLSTTSHLIAFDLSRPDSPVQLSATALNMTGRSVLAITGPPAFVGETLLVPALLGPGQGGLAVLRMEDPTRPILGARLTTSLVRDLAVVGDIAVAAGPQSLILDVAEPQRPRVIAKLRESSDLAHPLPDAQSRRVLLARTEIDSSFVESFAEFFDLVFFETHLLLLDLGRPEQPRVVARDVRRGTGSLRALATEGERSILLEDGPGVSVQDIDEARASFGTRQGLAAGPSVRVSVDPSRRRAATLRADWTALHHALDVFDLETGERTASVTALPPIGDLDLSDDRLALVSREGLLPFALHPQGGLQSGRLYAPFIHPTGVRLQGRRAFIADSVLGLRVVDLEDVLRPLPEGELVVGGASALDIAGERLLLATIHGPFSVDVSNPQRPEPLGVSRLELSELGGGFDAFFSPGHVARAGERAYVFHGFEGVEILSLGDRSPPQSQGTFETFGLARRGDGTKDRLWVISEEDPPEFEGGGHAELLELDARDPDALTEGGESIHLEVPGEPRDVVHLDRGELLVAAGSAGMVRLGAEPVPWPDAAPTATAPATKPDAAQPDWQIYLPLALAPAPAPKPGATRRLRSLGVSGGFARAVAIDGGRLWLAEGRRLSLLDPRDPTSDETRSLDLPGSVAKLDAAQGQVLALTHATRSAFGASFGAYPGPAGAAVAPGPPALLWIDVLPSGAPRLLARRELPRRPTDVAVTRMAGRNVAVVAYERLGTGGPSLEIHTLPDLAPLARLPLPSVPLRLESVGERILVLTTRGDDGLYWLHLDDPDGPFLGPEQDVDSLDGVAASMVIGDGHVYLLANAGRLSILRMGPGDAITPVGDHILTQMRDAKNRDLASIALAHSPGRIHLLGRSGAVVHHLDVSRPEAVRLTASSELPSLLSPVVDPALSPPSMATFADTLFVAGGPHGGLRFGTPQTGPAPDPDELPQLAQRLGAGVVTELALADGRMVGGSAFVPRLVELGPGGAAAALRARRSLDLPSTLGPTEIRGRGAQWWHLDARGSLSGVTWPPGSPGRVTGVAAVEERGPGAHDQQLALGDELAFATEADRVWVFDAAAASSPATIGHVHLPDAVRDLLHHEGLLFVANGPDGLVVLDARNPARLREVAHLPLAGEAHRLARVGDTLWVAVQPDPRGFPGAGRHGARLVAIDASTPAAPRLIAEVPLPTDHVGDMVPLEDALAIDLGAEGLALVNVADPRRAAVVARATLPGPPHDALHGDLIAEEGQIHLSLDLDGVWTLSVE
jgi:hypothetical protein